MRTTALFLNRFGEPLGDRGVQKILEKHLKKADLENASVHTLRHTFGTQHAVKGTSIKIIQEIMGHREIRSTRVYYSLFDEDMLYDIRRNLL